MQHLCNKIDILTVGDKIGFNVYLRFSAISKTYPQTEDLHIGRLCCQFTLGIVFGFNRCQFTTPKP